MLVFIIVSILINNSMFKTEKLPTSIAIANAGAANLKGDDFSHDGEKFMIFIKFVN